MNSDQDGLILKKPQFTSKKGQISSKTIMQRQKQKFVRVCVTVEFFSEPEIFEALHQGFEFPALSKSANNALSSFVDVSKVFYINQS